MGRKEVDPSGRIRSHTEYRHLAESKRNGVKLHKHRARISAPSAMFSALVFSKSSPMDSRSMRGKTNEKWKEQRSQDTNPVPNNIASTGVQA
jgi:hypothetical protein